MSVAPIRLAILEADVPIGSTRAKYGSYGGVFTSLLQKALDASNLPRGTLEISGWDVVNPDNAPDAQEEDMGGDWNWKRRKGYPKMEEVDAVLITGSRMWVSSNESEESEQEKQVPLSSSFTWLIRLKCRIQCLR